MDETTRIDAWLYSRLTADAQLVAVVGSRVYCESAPAAATYPFVLFSCYRSGRDLMVVNGERVLTAPDYLVMVVGEGRDYVALQPAADRIDTLLHNVTAETAALRVMSCVRTDTWRERIEEAGKAWSRLGGLYHLQVQPL